MLNRRGLLLGLASALAAPAIVHAGNLMPVRAMEPEFNDLINLMLDAAPQHSFVAQRHYWCSLGGQIFYCDIMADEFYTT